MAGRGQNLIAADTRPSLAGDVAVVFWYAERRIHDGGGFNGGVRGRAGNFKYASALLEPLIRHPESNLAAFNCNAITAIARHLINRC